MPANLHFNPGEGGGGKIYGKRLKKLYLGKSIEDLNTQAKFDVSKVHNGLMLSKSAKKVFEAANELYSNLKECDEEKAYVYFMKFIEVFNAIKKTKDYKEDKTYYNSMFGKDVLRALENSEALSCSLEKRYLDKITEIQVEKDMAQLRLQPKDASINQEIKDSKLSYFSNGISSSSSKKSMYDEEKDLLIDPIKLYSLMNERCTSFLLLDIRSAQDYKSCRIEHSMSINVPEEILLPAVTCKQIERQLNIEYRSTWIGRHQRDMLILLDWTSSNFDESVPLTRLKEAIQKWDDPTTSYKCEKKLHLLKGGLENFVLTYPTSVVNPHKARNPPDHAIKKGKGTKRIDELAKTIEYPDLGAAFIASPSPGKEVSSTAETNVRSFPTSAIKISTINPINSNHASKQSTTDLSGLNDVNLHPKSLYPSTMDLKGLDAFSSGAITISKESSPKRTFNNVPLIDRSSKPVSRFNTLDVELMNAKNNAVSSVEIDNSKDDASLHSMNETLNSTRLNLESSLPGNSILDNAIQDSSKRNNNSLLSDSAISDKSDRDGYSFKSGVPIIPDRSLKAKVILRSSEIHSSNQLYEPKQVIVPGDEIQKVLEAEQDLIEDCLEREKTQLDMEHQWEILRLRREKEAEEEMKEQIKINEEALMESLQRLGKEKEKKDSENEKLREQLKVLKEKLTLESALRQTLEGEKQKQENIKRKEAERQKLKQEVDQKREERRKKQQKELEERQRSLHETELKRQQIEKDLASRENLARHQYKIPLKGEGGQERYDQNMGLQRRSFSHSSPNIAKMMEDEDDADSESAATIPIPRFNREQKALMKNEALPSNDRSSPLIHRNMLRGRDVGARNFQGILTASVGKRGLTGLKNLGNTCYMNSIIQCLSNFTLPSQYLMDDKTFSRDLNRQSSSTRGEVAIEYSELIRALWSGQYRSIAPSDFKKLIGRYNEDFRGFDQQDAHELLSHLIEWLHDDLNEIRGKKEQLPEQKNEGVPDLQAAEIAWNMEKRVDKSFIRETFYGQWRSVLRCPDCHWSSIKYEVFFELVLQLPDGNGRCTLRQCIDSFLKPEHVEYKCPTCKVTRNMSKRFEIVRLPLILIIQFKRFMKDGFTQKKQNYVDFELSNLNLGQYATVGDGKLNHYKNYQLYGVCNHFGTMEGGHYIANCYSQVYKKWYKFDDSKVEALKEKHIRTVAAYILFYSANNNLY